MRNLQAFDQCTFSFYETVVKKKRNKKEDANFLLRLNEYTEDIRILFAAYDKAFDENSFHALEITPVSHQKKMDLLDLYSYEHKVFQDLKVSLTTVDNNRILNTCQNCTINEIGSFDHAIPKGDFPEYSVHPLNLFPSCGKCNQKKSVSWKNETQRLFLNLYVDPLPEDQYLFCNVSVTDEKISISFDIRNNGRIDDNFFALIKSHYDRLELCARFVDNSDSIISKMAIHIKTYAADVSIEQIRENTIKKNKELKKIFGYNFWESILEDALVQDDAFIHYVLEETH